MIKQEGDLDKEKEDLPKADGEAEQVPEKEKEPFDTDSLGKLEALEEAKTEITQATGKSVLMISKLIDELEEEKRAR